MKFTLTLVLGRYRHVPDFTENGEIIMAGIDKRILNFDRGLEGVLFSDPANVAKLPQATALTPWDGQVEARLEQIFLAPSREEILLRSLKPEALHPSLLMPGNFRNMLRSCGKRLSSAARQRGEFREAAAVLEELEACEELLNAYRNSLKQA